MRFFLQRFWLLPPAILLLCLLLAACTDTSETQSPSPPLAAFTVDYSAIPRATLQPVTPVPTVTPGGTTTVRFSQDILPWMQKTCVGCHGGIAGMWLIDYDHAVLPSINGPTIYPGDPERSPLYVYVRDGLMPANGDPVSPDQVDRLRRWIAEGALNN